MTVGVVLGKSVATGTGSAAAFSFNAPVAAVDELAVYTVVIATGVQTKQTRGGSGTYDFAVAINASTRFATVTLNNNLPDTHQIIILREVAIKQETDYVAGDAFPAETHEAALDKLTFITTQLSERIDRTVKFQEALASDLPGDITASSTLRANKAIKFASDGSIGLSTNDPDEQVTLATTQATNAATSATAASTSATLAGNYANKVDGVVTGSDYSSKAWALGGTGVTDTSSAGAAKEWATKTSGTVDTSDYSAKYWALDAEQSKLSAKASASAVANVFDSFDDTYLGKTTDAVSFTADASTDFLTSASHGLVDTQIIRVSGSDLPSGLSASTDYYVRDKTTNTFKLATSSGGTAINIADNGSGTNTWYHADFTTPSSSSWSANSSVITVASNVGVRVGQVVTGSGIGTSPKPNVVSIDGTSITISENMASAGSSVAVTFANKGVYGEYNTSKDGPATDNDGDALKTGALYFNSTDDEMRVYDGVNWLPATSAGSTSILIYKYSASGGQNTFSGTDANGATLSYVANNILVFLNGVKLDATDYTATNGTSVVLGTNAVASDELVVVAFKSFTTADMVPASTGGTFTGNVTFSGTTTHTGTITANGGLETDTNSKIQQKGAFMQSSTHQALVLGY